MVDIFKIVGILGLVLIISGVLIKPRNRKMRDILYIFGGLSLTTYSIYIKDVIFIVLQIIFILVAIYDLVKIQLKHKK